MADIPFQIQEHANSAQMPRLEGFVFLHFAWILIHRYYYNVTATKEYEAQGLLHILRAFCLSQSNPTNAVIIFSSQLFMGSTHHQFCAWIDRGSGFVCKHGLWCGILNYVKLPTGRGCTTPKFGLPPIGGENWAEAQPIQGSSVGSDIWQFHFCSLTERSQMPSKELEPELCVSPPMWEGVGGGSL